MFFVNRVLQYIKFMSVAGTIVIPAFLFEQQTDFPFTGRDSAHAAMLHGELYLLGGWNTAFTPVNSKDFRKYNPDTDTWTTLDSLPFRQPHPLCLTYDDGTGEKIWVVGGDRSNISWAYDTTTGWNMIEDSIPYLDDWASFNYGIINERFLICCGIDTNGDWHARTLLSDTTGRNWIRTAANNTIGYVANGTGAMPFMQGELGFACGGTLYSYVNPKLWTISLSGDVPTYTDRGTFPLQVWWTSAAALDDTAVIFIGGHNLARNDVNTTYTLTSWTSGATQVTGVPYSGRHAAILVDMGNDSLIYTTGRASGTFPDDVWFITDND